MNCKEFRSEHVGFIDDVMSAADMAAMRRHIRICARCSTLDVRIRRSLMVVRNLPQIEPSADFFARLSEGLKHAPPPARHRTSSIVVTFVVTTMAAAAVYFAMAVAVRRDSPSRPFPAQALAYRAEGVPSPIGNPELVPAVPAGIPIWPAMFMVGELPMHLANVELLDLGFAR